MCSHVLCLSPSTPPPSLLSPNKWALRTFLHLLIPLFQCLNFYWFLLYLVESQETLLRLSYIVLPFLSQFTHTTSMKPRMCSSKASLMKREFFKKWVKGLQIYSSFNKEMSVLERKKAIKLSADVAIASTRNAATRWSKALVADVEMSAVVGDGVARTAVEQILGRKLLEKKALMITCSKKIVRRSRAAVQRRVVRWRAASSIAKKLVRNRTRVLKRLVPGGKQLDEISLIKETLDYIASLQVQVDVMRHLAAAAERIDHQERSF